LVHTGSFSLPVIDMNQPHIHVERDDNVAKFWLCPVRLQSSGGFSRQEISQLSTIVQENQSQFLEKWNDYFHG